VATFDVKTAKEVEVVSAITGVNKTEVVQTLKKEEP
jgi:D-xylose transport system ATP-binding protein